MEAILQEQLTVAQAILAARDENSFGAVRLAELVIEMHRWLAEIPVGGPAVA